MLPGWGNTRIGQKTGKIAETAMRCLCGLSSHTGRLVSLFIIICNEYWPVCLCEEIRVHTFIESKIIRKVESTMNGMEIEVISCQRTIKGVGFIRSRKSEDKVMGMCEEMRIAAERKYVDVAEILLDDGGSKDIDRDVVGKLYEYMERDCIRAVMLRSVFDITDDDGDLCNFLRRANERGVTIYSMEHGICPAYEPWECEIGCEWR